MLTKLAVQAGADIDAAHVEMAQAVTCLVLCGAVEYRAPRLLTLAPPVLPRICDASQPCNACADCDIDDADDDAPTAAELAWGDYQDRERVCRSRM